MHGWHFLDSRGPRRTQCTLPRLAGQNRAGLHQAGGRPGHPPGDGVQGGGRGGADLPDPGGRGAGGPGLPAENWRNHPPIFQRAGAALRPAYWDGIAHMEHDNGEAEDRFPVFAAAAGRPLSRKIFTKALVENVNKSWQKSCRPLQ